ncbi:beta-glucosidase BoGH3B-like [Panicum miliaceum]|uniref:Beta-glucosidase BoGH3B-like n=1 Tax=Panicum miliaceum TaxID=4540 RepID=A0A3L6T7R8_PANMI|nr:beta-glucosidase BoGH3B-like [Panicum miliaceum]
MIPYTYTEFIDMAVRRILRVKFTMGLFENPYGDPSLACELGKLEHRELAREAVRSHADNLGYQCGGWTITWQGQGGNNLTAGTTILVGGIRRAVDCGTEGRWSTPRTQTPASSSGTRAGRFDYAVVIIGEMRTPSRSATSRQGDNLNLTVPAPGPGVIWTVCGGGGIRCAAVLVSGRPLAVEPFVGAVDALGVIDVLFGDYGFTGKLTRTWFRSVEQLPMNVGDAH